MAPAWPGYRRDASCRNKEWTFSCLRDRKRVGGRVYTLDELPGRPEAGATQSGTKYHALNQVIGELGIGTENIRPGAPGMTLLVNDTL